MGAVRNARAPKGGRVPSRAPKPSPKGYGGCGGLEHTPLERLEAGWKAGWNCIKWLTSAIYTEKGSNGGNPRLEGGWKRLEGKNGGNQPFASSNGRNQPFFTRVIVMPLQP